MTAGPNDALLQECRDLFRDRLLEAVRATFDGVAESLATLADKSKDPAARNRYLDARDIAIKHRDVIEAQFRRRLSPSSRTVSTSRATAAGSRTSPWTTCSSWPTTSSTRHLPS